MSAKVDQAGLALRLLGTHVSQRTEDISGHRQPDVGFRTGKTKIRKPNVGVAIDKQIGRLNVAMNDSLPVGVVKSVGDVGHHPSHLAVVVVAIGGVSRGNRGNWPSVVRCETYGG